MSTCHLAYRTSHPLPVHQVNLKTHLAHLTVPLVSPHQGALWLRRSRVHLPKLLECRAPLYSDRSAHLFDRRSSLTVRARASPDCRRPHARRSTYQNALLPERPTARTSVRPHTRAARPHPGSRACLPNVFTSLRAHPHAQGPRASKVSRTHHQRHLCQGAPVPSHVGADLGARHIPGLRAGGECARALAIFAK